MKKEAVNQCRRQLKGKKAQVFKYQTNPIPHPNGPIRSQVLVYNQDRSIMGEFANTPELEQHVFKGAFKVYVKGVYDDVTGQVIVIKPTYARSW